MVKLVGGDEQFVGRCAALAGCVFDDQIFTCGLVGSRSDGTLSHFEEPADAMLLMHHVIAGFELHKVDGLTATFRGFCLSRGRCTSGQVAFGKQRDFRRVVNESVDGTRSDAVEVGDSRFVDGTLESNKGTLRSCSDGDGIAGIKKTFDTGCGFDFIPAIFAGIGSVELNVSFPAWVHAETRELPYVVP